MPPRSSCRHISTPTTWPKSWAGSEENTSSRALTLTCASSFLMGSRPAAMAGGMYVLQSAVMREKPPKDCSGMMPGRMGTWRGG